MIGPGSSPSRGQLTLNTPADAVMAVAGTYYKISGDFSDGYACGFRVEDEKLIYTGPSGVCFLLNGVSDVAVDKACEMTYGLHINGILQADAQTPHTFPASARTQTLAITGLLRLNQNDEIDVYAKSNQANTTANVRNLRVTLWGQK